MKGLEAFGKLCNRVPDDIPGIRVWTETTEDEHIDREVDPLTGHPFYPHQPVTYWFVEVKLCGGKVRAGGVNLEEAVLGLNKNLNGMKRALSEG